MTETFKNSYFYPLPNECDYFLQDRNVIKNVDLYKQYKLQDLSQLSKKIAFDLVTTLNVNCVYWVQASKLRKFVTKLVNLETLYAIQTNLSLTPEDTEALSRSKIKKLGVSVTRDEQLGLNKIPCVVNLYINVLNAKTLVSPIMLETIFPNLDKLWIHVEEPCGREIILHSLYAENKSKIFCQVDAPVPTITYDHYKLLTYYSARRAWQPYVMCCEKLDPDQVRSKNIFDVKTSLISWRVLCDLHCNIPYGPEDSRRLFVNEGTLSSISFQELNFSHNDPNCNERLREAVREILRSSCAEKLQKLCIMMCLLENNYALESVPVQDPHSFSRKRIGIENVAASHPLTEAFENFSNLKHLEIYVCSETSHHSAIQGYSLISIFENLESLTLELPITVDGNFLNHVLKNCRRLQVLKIKSQTQNEKLNYHICNSIANATSLKDFRYENRRIQLDRLLQNMCSIRSKKLERIVLMCKEIDKFSAAPLTKLLDNNPQLVFLYFVIKECTENAIKMAQQTLNTYKKLHPSKVFLIKKVNVFNKIGYPIPDVHFTEMIKTETSVSSLRPLEHFINF